MSDREILTTTMLALDEMKREVDEADRRTAVADAEVVRLRAECERLRPVVAAVRKWIESDGSIGAIIDAMDVLDVHVANSVGVDPAAEDRKMRAVYQAALAWRVGRDRNIVGTAPSGGQRSASGVALIDAIDAAGVGGEK